MSLWGLGEPVIAAKGLLLCSCEEARPYIADIPVLHGQLNMQILRGITRPLEVGNYLKNITIGLKMEYIPKKKGKSQHSDRFLEVYVFFMMTLSCKSGLITY